MSLIEKIKAGGDLNNIDPVMFDLCEVDKVWFVTWKNPTPSVSFFSIFTSLNDDFKIVRHSMIMKMAEVPSASDIETEEDPSY